MFKKNKTLNVRGRLLVLEKPLVMGILNATPDSFYNAGRDGDFKGLMKNAEKMVSEGAAFLDIGGMSTRPGALQISVDEEWQRIEEAIKTIKKNFPKIFLSIDTFRAEIARRSALEGIDMINDISAGDMDKAMIATVAELGLPYVAMHMQGTPQTMQQHPQYDNVARDVFDYFVQKTEQLELAGVKDIVIDPGFGFGKTVRQNYQLLKNLHTFEILGKPVMVGLSRKSMIYKVLGNMPDEALAGTIALNRSALEQGADILRVHDVREAVEVVRLFEYAKNV